MPLESSIVKRIMDRLRSIPGAVVEKIHGSQYQSKGLPDLMAWIPCPASQRPSCDAYGLELKRAGQYPTYKQAQTLHKMRRAGVRVGVVRNMADLEQVLQGKLPAVVGTARVSALYRCELCQLPKDGTIKGCPESYSAANREEVSEDEA